MRNEKGFTLIELLVVIAIIGLLGTLSVTSFSKARVKSRDVKRSADLRQIHTALEMYNDTNGHYPIVATWASFDSPSYSGTAVTNPAATNLTEALRTWLGGGAQDPKNLGGDSGYLYRSTANGLDFCLLIYRTPENLHNYGESLWNPYRCSAVNAEGRCTTAGTSGGPANSVYMSSPGWPTVGC
jgi:prepilin-type N-terminal cleavage/methylation domain-containing protein